MSCRSASTVLVRGLRALVAEPQRDGRHVDAGLEQVHGGGVADNVWRHAFHGQARTSLMCPLARLIKQMGDALSRQAVAARVAERIVGRGLTFLVEPLAQTAAGSGPQGYGSLLAPLSEELDDCGGAEAHVCAPKRHELGDTGPGVVQGQQEDVVPPSAVGRAVTAGQDGVHFRSRQVVDLSSWRALAGNREDARRQVEGLRRAQRCEADEGADGGQTRIAGLNAVAAILFKVVEERQAHGSIEVVEGERIGLPLAVLVEKLERRVRGLEGASSLRQGLPKPGRSAGRRPRVRRTLQSVLAPREAGVPHAARSARNTSCVKPHSVNGCPRNRVRYNATYSIADRGRNPRSSRSSTTC